MPTKLKVLILEDRAADAELVLHELRRAGYEPEWKRVETEADYRNQLDQGWEIILADYNLPEYDGLRALELLRGRGLDIPFIIVSGTIGEEKAVAAIKTGANDYVMKDRLGRLGSAVERELREAVAQRERKQAEEALRESEERFRKYIDRTPDGIFMVDGTGRYTKANRSATRITGYSEDELVQMSIRDMLAEESLEDGQAHFRRLMETGAATADLWHQRKNGSKCCLTIDAVKISETHVLGFFKDITDRKQAEEELRREKDFAQSLIQTAQAVVLVLDLQGRIVQFNPYLEEISGYRLDDVRGRDWCTTFLPSREQAQTRELFKKAISGTQTKGKCTAIVTKDGREILIEWYDKALRNSDGMISVLLAIGHDITARQLAGERERLAHEVLKLLNKPERSSDTIQEILHLIKKTMGFEAVGIRLKEGDDYPYYETDGFPDHFVQVERYLCARNGAGEIVRDSQGEPFLECMCGNILCGRTNPKLPFFTDGGSFWTNCTTELLATTTEEDRQARTRNYCNVEGYESVALIPLRSGEEIIGLMQFNDHRRDQFNLEMIQFFEGQGASIGVELVRKQVNEELRQSNEKFQMLFEQAADCIFLLEITHEGIPMIRDMNEAATRLLGYEKDELIGQPVSFLNVEPDVSKEVAERRKKVLSIKGATFEEKHRCKDGTTRVFECSVKEMKIGSRTLALSVERDITERKHEAEEKARLTDQLQQAMKMEAVGRLAGGVAHDFNNLLTGITGNVSLALMDLAPTDPLHDTLTEVNKAADSAASLTRQLLAFSRKQMVEPRIVNLSELVTNLSKMLARLIGEDIEMKNTLAGDLLAVKIDPGQFEQVIVNLVVNSRDAMPNGGKMLIETSNVELDAEYCETHPYIAPGSYVRLAVKDTGVGISDEVKSHLFEPFFTTKALGRGTGLGLATTYGTVKQAGGSIELYSEVGRGATFTIYLPAVAEKADKLEMRGRALDLKGGNETILLVEDEPMLRGIAVKILKRMGYKVLDAANGEKALLLAKGFNSQIDLLLTDVIMPGLNGVQLAERLKQIHPEMPVLFMSGYTDDILTDHGAKEGMINFIEKPYSPQKLSTKIREVLDRKGSLQNSEIKAR